MEDIYFNIGKIVNTHGLKGDIKVYPLTDDPERFNLLKSIRVFNNENIEKVYELERSRVQKNVVILKIKGIDTIEQAELLKNYTIKVLREEALELSEDEFYISDIIGLSVYEKEEFIGELKDVIQTAANDVYIIKRENKRDLLLPVIKSCILKVDIDGKRIEVSIPKGLE
ncbi:MAG: ribosome maturation factor RimM [Defluviitaleaceae bacterium]|nr:ribosome maturation factor RimM [Defluviitaleaceae bacterium]